jgi:chromate reductase
MYTVGYFVGSLAKASINRKLATALVRLAPAELVLTEIPFRELPLYCYDSDADFPPVARALKDAIAAVDAILFVTPEYNRSIPGGLKNAIGTAIAQAHLRSIMAFCNSPLMNSIEAYIQFEQGLITDDGEVTNESTAKFLRGFMTEFHGFIGRVYTVLPRESAR